MANSETWIKAQPECFLNFPMRYVVEYNRIKEKCRLCNIKELTSVFELWVFKKQLHFILESTGTVVFTAIAEYFNLTNFHRLTCDGILNNKMKIPGI